MYLTDLSFIEEGTPDLTEDRLVNFSKMRMVSSRGGGRATYLGMYLTDLFFIEEGTPDLTEDRLVNIREGWGATCLGMNLS